MDSKPPTPLAEQSDKSKKYDRQLRLWGDHGQALLETSHICVCGASMAAGSLEGMGASGVLGSEVLRSLVLPGIGKITILDDAIVTVADLGNNLFVSEAALGQPRGECLLQGLLEMNPDVRGSFVEQSTEDVLRSQPSFFDNFNLVVAVNMTEKTLIELSECLWKAKVPLLAVRTYGLIGYLRIQVEEHTIIESHPDNEISDLRLLDPFPALKDYFDSINLESLDDKQHSHTPYVVIIYKYLQKFIEEYGAPPKNFEEKKRLAQMISNGMRHKSATDYEENFVEASNAVNACLVKPGVPSSLQDLFMMIPCPLMPSSSSFWQALAGLQAFVDTQKRLPVTGVVPDMTADSASYVRLQNIYREQAALDAECVLKSSQLSVSQNYCSNCHSSNASVTGNGSPGSTSSGSARATPETRVISEVDAKCTGSPSESLVRLMCRHAAHLRVLHGSSLAAEYRDRVDLGGPDIEVCESDAAWYVMLRSIDMFQSEFRYYPGYYDGQLDTDIVRLKICVTKLLSEWSIGGNQSISIKDDYIEEMCRYGAAQIHSVASYIGGCAAHEVIKLLTFQYIPVDNTLIYNAITATTVTLKL